VHISLAAVFHEFVRFLVTAKSTVCPRFMIEPPSEQQHTTWMGVSMSKASIVAGFDLAEILMLTVGVLVIAAIVYVI
jgi:hypothetical protein